MRRAQILAGAVTGSLGSFASNPFDVVKVGMMAEAGAFCKETNTYTSGLRAGQPPTWESTFHALRSITEQGPAVAFRGATPSVTRGALMAAAQLASYEYAISATRHRLHRTAHDAHSIAHLLSPIYSTSYLTAAHLSLSQSLQV